MPQDVTYADLRFTQSHPEGTRLEDLTYENVQVSRRQDQKAGAKRPAWCAALGFAGAALVLLAALIGLGVHYQRIQKTSEEEKVQLSERLREEEERVQAVQTQLSWAKRELNRIRDTLTESQHQEMQNLKREEALNASWVQVAKDWCPEDWVLYHGKCLLFSTGRKIWAESNAACEAQSSRLLITRSWKPAWFKGLLGNSEHWIGLRRQSEQTSPWTWVNGSAYEGKALPQRHSRYYGNCALLNAGKLQHASCDSSFPYICERAKGGEEPGEEKSHRPPSAR
ncbi:oxidized low-density lipoprotein receptor 1-like [Anolis sagrei]|uniref:oxidized low-density lipoprotein receptor 1-like n=1 Tax=Anolis sagrei TaxID=38937 RepID=UPI00351F88C6